MLRQPIVAGNWKMNGSLDENQQLLQSISHGLNVNMKSKAQVLVFPPFTYLLQVAQLLADLTSENECLIGLGAQNLSEQHNGAFTGEIAATMLTDIGCSHVLLGHSERRSLYQESNQLVAAKFMTAIDAGLTPILCVGESLSQRDAGRTMDIVFEQLGAVVDSVGVSALGKGIIAYEPVWAIGTGKTATPEQAQDVHNGIRSHIKALDAQVASKIQILYGGSVNATNAAEIFAMSDIDGGLIGGASLKADNFLNICVAAG